MKIAVLVKVVPDTWGDRDLDPETGLVVRADDAGTLDEISERAVEVAVAHAEASSDVEVVLVTMGPAAVTGPLRRGLAIGADRALVVTDDALRGADLPLTARVLAAAVSRLEADLVLAGDRSTDGTTGVLPAMVAEVLELPCLSAVGTVELAPGRVAATRTASGWTERLGAPLPAVVSITEALPEPRLPGFKAVVAAKKKPCDVVSAADLGVDVDVTSPSSILVSVARTPPRAAGTRIVDDGDAGAVLARYLVDHQLL